MTPNQRKWLASHDDRGYLDKGVARKLDIAIGDLIRAGYVRNIGPDEPTMWDLVITQRGRDALASDIAASIRARGGEDIMQELANVSQELGLK